MADDVRSTQTEHARTVATEAVRRSGPATPAPPSWKGRAAVAIGAGAVVAAIGVVAMSAGNESVDAQEGRGPGRFGPPCALPAAFTGFAPGTDAARVARARGESPTRLTARAAVADLALSGVRIEVRDGARVVRAEDLGDMRAAGQPLTIAVGDVDDKGAPIPPGIYDVMLSATVTGTDECGDRATHSVSTRAGLLAVS